MNLVSLLFGFSGRINRVQYWLGCVIGGVGGAMLLFLLTVLTIPQGGYPKSPEGVAQFISSVSIAFGLPLLLIGWVGTALQTKRFHDRGRSGLWTLAPMVPTLMIIISVISGVATGANFEHIASSIAMWFLLLQVIQLVMFVDLGCMPSKAEPNKYGNPPGGGFSGGAPMGGAPAPAPSRGGRAPVTVPGMGGSTLTNAESAIERAIAERGKQQQQAPSPRPAMAMAAQPAAGGLRPAASGSFGRKASS